MDVNYFLHIWQIYAVSPFANFVVFVDNKAATAAPESVMVEVVGKNITPAGVDYTVQVQRTGSSLVGGNMNLVQTDTLAGHGVMVNKAGLVKVPAGVDSVTLYGKIRSLNYQAATAITAETRVGETIVFNKQ